MAAQPRDPIKVGFQQFVAGGSAGLVEILIMQPLDVVKRSVWQKFFKKA